jgi:hypothetical protein
LSLVEEGSILQENAHEIAIAKTGLKAATEEGPADNVDVDEGEAHDADVGDLQDLLVYAILKLVWCLLAHNVTAAARSFVEVVDDLTEDDTHKREWRTGGDGGNGANNEENYIDP